MELKGKYKKSEAEFYNCSVLIENGVIHEVIVPDVKPIEYFSINPKENAEFEYYKLSSKKGFSPIESNYKLQYNNESDSTNTIYLNLSKWELFQVRRQKKELLYQDRSLKLGLLKAGIISLFSLTFFSLGVFYEKCIQSKKDNNIENQTPVRYSDNKINTSPFEKKSKSIKGMSLKKKDSLLTNE